MLTHTVQNTPLPIKQNALNPRSKTCSHLSVTNLAPFVTATKTFTMCQDQAHHYVLHTFPAEPKEHSITHEPEITPHPQKNPLSEWRPHQALINSFRHSCIGFFPPVTLQTKPLSKASHRRHCLFRIYTGRIQQSKV